MLENNISDLIHGHGTNFNPLANLLNELELGGENMVLMNFHPNIYFVMAVMIADDMVYMVAYYLYKVKFLK